MRLLWVCVLVALLAPAAAGADQPPTDRLLTGTRITVSLQIAADFWDATPDCDVRVYAATPAELLEATGEDAEAATTLGVPAGQTVCPIWLSDVIAANSVENRIRACVDEVHELGHELGYPHDDLPASVMAPRGFTPWPCFNRFAPHGYIRVWHELHAGEPWATRPSPPPL